MNICIATPEYLPTPGGIASLYGHLLPLLAEAGHRVTLVTAGEPQAEDRTQVGAGAGAHPGVEIVRVEPLVRQQERQMQGLLGDWWDACWALGTGLGLRDWLRANAAERQFDVVEAPELYGCGPFLLDLELPPLVLACHGSLGQVHTYNQKPLPAGMEILTGLEVMAAALADEVVCHSPLLVDDWSRYLGRTVAFATAPWRPDAPIAPWEPSASPRAAGAPLRALVVGRLEVLKGAGEVLEALRLLRAQDLAIHVRWVGADTPTAPGGTSLQGHLQQAYPDLWGSAFEWTPRLDRPAVRQAQAQADVVLVSSRWETLGLAGVEAMSVGTPVIVSTGAGMAYLCVDGENSLVVPPGDSAALARALQRLAGDAALRQRLGAAGRVTVLREFAPAKIVAERLAVYEAARARHAYRRAHPYAPVPVNALVDRACQAVQQRVDALRERYEGLSGRQHLDLALRRLRARLAGPGEGGGPP